MKHQTDLIPSDEAALIVELFVHRQEIYAEEDVLRLTRIAPARLERALKEGEVEPVASEHARWFAWGDVAHLALLRWTPRMVMQALRAVNAAHSLPPLNQTRVISLELPVYLIRILHWHALDRSDAGAPPLNASDIAVDALRDLAEDTDDDAEHEIPGFLAARNFPVSPPLLQIVKPACIFCGTPLPLGETDICETCQIRHLPDARARDD